jgi:hypothetical protein
MFKNKNYTYRMDHENGNSFKIYLFLLSRVFQEFFQILRGQVFQCQNIKFFEPLSIHLPFLLLFYTFLVSNNFFKILHYEIFLQNKKNI